MTSVNEEKENAFKVLVEKMMIAEKVVEEQGYYSEEDVEKTLSDI